MEGESTVFIEFMLAQIDNILDELLNQMTNSATDDAILDANGANHDVDNMEGRLLSCLEQNPCITQTDLAEELSLSRRTVQRMMKKLMDDGKDKESRFNQNRLLENKGKVVSEEYSVKESLPADSVCNKRNLLAVCLWKSYSDMRSSAG